MLHALEAWQNFYVIVGSSAGALTGLQFVVATVTYIVATRGRREPELRHERGRHR